MSLWEAKNLSSLLITPSQTLYSTYLFFGREREGGCLCVRARVCKNHPGIKGSIAEAKDKSRFILDNQAEEFYCELSSELPGR